MRIIIAAALTACLSGAAWAGAEDRIPLAYNCEARAGGEIDADAISAQVEDALDRALSALERAELDPATLAEVEAQMDAALAEVELELAAHEGRSSFSEAEEAALETRLEIVMARAQSALEAAADRIEDAAAARKAKLWRPRY